jgi:hypothetical protein
MGRYLDISQEILRGLAQPRIAPDESAHDPYYIRIRAAHSKLNRTDYPPTMIRWLEQAAPALYTELTCQIPNELSSLWATQASLEKFQGVLDQLIGTHQEACRLYREEKSRNKMERSCTRAEGPRSNV